MNDMYRIEINFMPTNEEDLSSVPAEAWTKYMNSAVA